MALDAGRFGEKGGGFSTAAAGGGGMGFLDSIMKMFQGTDMFDLGSLALTGWGMDKSFGIQDEQLKLLQGQDKRAARASNTNFANQQFMAQQMGGLPPPVSTSLAGITPEEQLLISP